MVATKRGKYISSQIVRTSCKGSSVKVEEAKLILVIMQKRLEWYTEKEEIFAPY